VLGRAQAVAARGRAPRQSWSLRAVPEADPNGT
jgi:hypothetical protein